MSSTNMLNVGKTRTWKSSENAEEKERIGAKQPYLKHEVFKQFEVFYFTKTAKSLVATEQDVQPNGCKLIFLWV